jgi:hypothetical protein
MYRTKYERAILGVQTLETTPEVKRFMEYLEAKGVLCDQIIKIAGKNYAFSRSQGTTIV